MTVAWGSVGGHFFFLSFLCCFSLCAIFHVISNVTCTMVTTSVSSIRISEIDIQHPSFRRKHREGSLQKAALLTPASLWGECSESMRTQSRLTSWVSAFRRCSAAVTGYHKNCRNSTQNAPVRKNGTGAFCVFRSAVGSCRSRSKCTKAGREVWRARERKIQAIYLKNASSVVLSL